VNSTQNDRLIEPMSGGVAASFAYHRLSKEEPGRTTKACSIKPGSGQWFAFNGRFPLAPSKTWPHTVILVVCSIRRIPML